MSKKSSKNRSKSATPALPTTSSTTTTVDYYPKTAQAFEALIMAFVEAQGVLRVGRNVNWRVEIAKQMGASPGYVRKPDSDDPPEQAELLHRERAELPNGLRELNRAVDTYFEAEARFRTQVERAKVAIDAAAFELDSPQTPPLRRTTIAIRRALRNLSGSVPYPVTSGWSAAAEPTVLERIGITAHRVSVWIEELRLLVRPRHTMPPPSLAGTAWDASKPPEQPPTRRKRASREAREPKRPRSELRAELAQAGKLARLAEELPDLQVEILRALQSQGAAARSDLVSLSYLCEHALGRRAPKSLAWPLIEMKRAQLIATATGRKGGYWLLPLGEAVLQQLDATTAASRRAPQRVEEATSAD